MNASGGIDTWSALEADLLPRLAEFGITRLADTTHLDVLSTPTASVTKPGTSDVIWVYSGKGQTRAQARVTAIMECLERTGALWSPEMPVVIETERVLTRTHAVWAPDRFTYRRRPGSSSDDALPWLCATGLRGATTVMVPADVCFNGPRPADMPASPFLLGTSNGLAAASSVEDALRHAMLEVIERDVVSQAEVRASHLGFRFLAAAVAAMGLSAGVMNGFADDVEHGRTIRTGTLPGNARRIVERYVAAGLDVVVKELPNLFGLPAYGACAVEQSDLGRYLGCAGYAVRTNGRAAVEAALLELAQTRATDLQGAREDRHEPEKQRLDVRPDRHWLATPGATTFAYVDHDGPADVSVILDHCAQAGLGEVAYVQFPGWPGIAVVRVVVPDAETWHVTGGWSDIGRRLRETVGGR